MAVGDVFKKRRNLVQQPTPKSFNPQNQDVLARASAALDAVKQDRLNPMYGGAQGYAAPGQNASIMGSPGLRTFVDSVGRGFQGFGPMGKTLFDQYHSSDKQNPMYGGQQLYAAPGANGVTAFNGPNTPTISNPINRELAPAYDPRTASIDSARARIDARVQQSQRDNPMSSRTSSPYDSMTQSDRMLQRNMDFIQTNPRPRTSLDAGRMGQQAFDQGTSGLANGYNGILNPLRVQPEEKFYLADRNARRVVGGGAAADPTGLSRRFGGNALDEYNATGMTWQEREKAAEFAADAPNRNRAQQVMLQKRAEREAARAADPVGNAARLQRIADATAARKAKHDEFKANNGGMNYGQARRAERKEGLKQRSYDKAILKGMNPFGPEAQARFPDQVSAAKGGQNQAGPNLLAAAATNKFMPNGIVTPDSSQAARDTLKVMAEGGTTPEGAKLPPSPMFAGLAASPDNIQGVHFGIQQMVQEGKDLGVEDIRNLHAAAVAMQAGYGTSSYDPFDMTYGAEAEGLFGSVDTEHTKVFGPMYKQLVGMKAPTDEALLGWWQSFKGNIRPDTNRFIGGSSIFSGEGAPTVSPGGYEYPVRPKKEEPFLRNPMKP